MKMTMTLRGRAAGAVAAVSLLGSLMTGLSASPAAAAPADVTSILVVGQSPRICGWLTPYGSQRAVFAVVRSAEGDACRTAIGFLKKRYGVRQTQAYQADCTFWERRTGARICGVSKTKFAELTGKYSWYVVRSDGGLVYQST